MTASDSKRDASLVQPPSLLLASDDLMVVGSVQGACDRQGWKLISTSRGKVDPDEAAAASVVVVDLGASWNLEELRFLVEVCSGVVAGFGPHVQTARLAAARSAGLSPVLARGAFLGGLDGFLTARGQASDQ